MEQQGDNMGIEVRIIKRYANRKLYDLKESSYVTLDEIAQFVKKGEEIRVVDNKTKEDLTALTLTQIIFEEEKKKKRILPVSTLRDVIQSGGEFIQKRITEPVTSMRDEAERTVASLRGEAERKVGRLVKIEGIEELKVVVRDLVENTHQLYDDLQRRTDERVRVVLSSLPQFSLLRKEVEALKTQVSALEGSVSKSKSKSTKPKS